MNGLFQRPPKIYSVSELAGRINQFLDAEFSDLRVQGEISSFSRHKSGHFFFALKDKESALPAVMFRFQALALRFEPEIGLEVVVRGRLNYYEPRGDLRMIAESMEPVGKGALQLALEQMRAKLEKEGLFAPERKKPVPAFCRRIAIITSETGAVFQDMLKVFRQNHTRIEVLLIPSRVQGEAAELELASALELANQPAVANPRGRLGLDAIILARGGGSLEDLWAFNTERLARAIGRSRLPVISAVGHEVDYTISDLAADLRAPTPTAAAELIARSQKDMLRRLAAGRQELAAAVSDELRLKSETVKQFLKLGPRVRYELMGRQKDLALKRLGLRSEAAGIIHAGEAQWQELAQKLLRLSPSAWLQRSGQRLHGLESHLNHRVRQGLAHDRELLLQAAARLHTLSPLSTLNRGYAIARDKQTNKVIKSESEVALGSLVQIIIHRGELGARVEEKKARNPWEEYEDQEDNEG